MKTLGRLALGADLVALGAVMLGSWTRINGAGETCPDWPLCHGSIVPAMGDGTIWEWMHRLLALLVAPLVVALIVVAWRRRARSPFIAPTVAVIAALFLAQVLLGAATVRLANTPISVVLHWGTAMAFIAALSAMAIFAAAAERPEPPSAGRGRTGNRAYGGLRSYRPRRVYDNVRGGVRQLQRRRSRLPVDSGMRRKRRRIYRRSNRTNAASLRRRYHAALRGRFAGCGVGASGVGAGSRCGHGRRCARRRSKFCSGCSTSRCGSRWNYVRRTRSTPRWHSWRSSSRRCSPPSRQSRCARAPE